MPRKAKYVPVKFDKRLRLDSPEIRTYAMALDRFQRWAEYRGVSFTRAMRVAMVRMMRRR